VESAVCSRSSSQCDLRTISAGEGVFEEKQIPVVAADALGVSVDGVVGGFVVGSGMLSICSCKFCFFGVAGLQVSMSCLVGVHPLYCHYLDEVMKDSALFMKKLKKLKLYFLKLTELHLKRNIEMCSQNHCCRGKAVSITYFECVFVAVDILHAKCMHCGHLWLVWLYHIIPHYLLNSMT
jgi:hypothetical protein